MDNLLFSRGFYFLVELFLKSSLILAITLVVSFLVRKRPASFRHLLLVVALTGLLMLPLLMAFAPGWQTGILPSSWARPVENNTFAIDLVALQKGPLSAGSAVARVNGEQGLKEPLREIRESSPAFSVFNSGDFYRYCIMILWWAGLMFLLLKLMVGLWGTARLTHQGVTIEGYPWTQLFSVFLSKTPLKKRVRLLRNKRVVVPMTWGVINPVVIMPAESEHWPLAQCSSVLFHELSHVKRGDFLVRLLARISCSFYWFNPLCWVVFRKLKREQEKACDEMVLKTGIKPSTYASYLLQMKKSLEQIHYLPAAAVGMAGKSEFKDRLVSILKQKLNLKEVKMKTKIILSIICVLAVTLIGTARPSRSRAVVYIDNGDENAIDVRLSEAVEAAEVKSASTKEAKAEAEEKKGKEDKDKKKKKEKVNARVKVNVNDKVLVKVKEKDTGKGKKAVKEVIFIPEGSDFHIKELKEDEGHLLVYEGSDIYMLTKDKGKLKKVKVEKGKVLIGEDDWPVTIYIQPGIKGKGKDKVKVVKIVADRLQMEGGKIKAEAGNLVIEGEKDGETWIYEIKEKKSGKKEAHLEVVELAEPGLVKIAEDADGVIELREIKEFNLGEGKVMAISKGVTGKKGIFTGFYSKAKLGKKQIYELMKAVSQLEKKLPGCFKVESKIGDHRQKITINCSDSEPDKKDVEKAVKAIKVLKKELMKVLGDKKGKKN